MPALAWTPELVAALATLFGAWIGASLVLLIKEKARSTAKLQFEETIIGVMAKFKEELLSSLDERYVMAKGADLTGAEIRRRLDDNEDRFEGVNKYVHSRLHSISNEITGLQFETESLSKRADEANSRIRHLENRRQPN